MCRGIAAILILTLTFKVIHEEAREIRALARRQRISVSEYLRRQALPHRSKSLEINREVCAYTRATILGRTAEVPPLNTESVRGLLADFP